MNPVLTSKFRKIVKIALEEHVDPWAEHHIDKLPAEKVVRHKYLPKSQTWVSDNSIIKMEETPFDHGAQRQVYRLKKISQAPTAKWSKIDWSKSPNYVAKSYRTKDGTIDITGDRNRCFDDIRLQYEVYRACQYRPVCLLTTAFIVGCILGRQI